MLYIVRRTLYAEYTIAYIHAPASTGYTQPVRARPLVYIHLYYTDCTTHKIIGTIFAYERLIESKQPRNPSLPEIHGFSVSIHPFIDVRVFHT